jgi:hypothetical protein
LPRDAQQASFILYIWKKTWERMARAVSTISILRMIHLLQFTKLCLLQTV